MYVYGRFCRSSPVVVVVVVVVVVALKNLKRS